VATASTSAEHSKTGSVVYEDLDEHQSDDNDETPRRCTADVGAHVSVSENSFHRNFGVGTPYFPTPWSTLEAPLSFCPVLADGFDPRDGMGSALTAAPALTLCWTRGDELTNARWAGVAVLIVVLLFVVYAVSRIADGFS
jgi:hypothetical protein